MDSFLASHVDQWKGVPQYQDVEASWWTPNQSLTFSCPKGCQLQDSGWSQLLTADIQRRTLFCREHGFARIYLISGPEAERLNWSPTSY